MNRLLEFLIPRNHWRRDPFPSLEQTPVSHPGANQVRAVRDADHHQSELPKTVNGTVRVRRHHHHHPNRVGIPQVDQ